MLLPIVAERVLTELVEKPEYDAGDQISIKNVQPDLVLEYGQESLEVCAKN